MTTISRRGFTRRLHGILNWCTYDIHAEYGAVEAARVLLKTPVDGIEDFVRAYQSKGTAHHDMQKKIDAVLELRTLTIDQNKPLPKWRYGKL